MLVTPMSTLMTMLADLIANTLNLPNPAKVRLFKNQPVLSKSSVLADFTEADFAGYAPGPNIGWSAPQINANNQAETVGTLSVFRAGAGIVPQTIYGYYVTDNLAVPTVLLWAENFPAPIVLTVPNQAINVLPVFVLDDLT